MENINNKLKKKNVKYKNNNIVYTIFVYRKIIYIALMLIGEMAFDK